MPRLQAGTSHPVTRRVTTIRTEVSISASGGAEGSSRCAGMSLPYGWKQRGMSLPYGREQRGVEAPPPTYLDP